jgi:hypothetical protein
MRPYAVGLATGGHVGRKDLPRQVTSSVVKCGPYFLTQIITGPQWLRLLLDLQPERISDPYVTATGICPVYGQPQDDVVRAAVLRGTDEANAEFGTNWHPLEIRYSYSGYDNQNCKLMGRAAYNIVKELAQRGKEHIMVMPEPSTP